MRMRLTVFLLFQFFLVLFVSSAMSASPPSPWEIEGIRGGKAPDFVIRDINNSPFNLSAFRGKVVILNFWATWCPSCRAEMPSLNNLYRELRDKGLEVLAVSADRSRSAVRDYISKNHLDIRVALDPENKVSRQFKVFSIPTTFLIDRTGIIIERYIGEEDWTSPEIKKKIKEALGIP